MPHAAAAGVENLCELWAQELSWLSEAIAFAGGHAVMWRFCWENRYLHACDFSILIARRRPLEKEERSSCGIPTCVVGGSHPFSALFEASDTNIPPSEPGYKRVSYS